MPGYGDRARVRRQRWKNKKMRGRGEQIGGDRRRSGAETAVVM